MKEKYKVIIFVILTLFFTGVIFFVDTFFLSEKLKNNLEEKNIEQSLFENDENIDKNSSIEYIEIVKKIIKEKALKEKKDDSELHRKILELKKNNSHYKGDENIVKKINFAFIPKNFEKKQEQEKIYIGKTLHSDVFYSFLKNIDVLFYERIGDVRGKMKNRQVKLFGPQYMDDDELIGVFIHEFSHYIDIYSLERNKQKDISNQFYNISWNSTKIIKSGLKQKDFVSGYSMTNKYEDFAESLTYYILHNRDFLEKSINSDILRKKYNFFNLVLFKSEIFKNTDFSKNNKVKDYYRDITKIHFSRKNFLQYLKKSI